MANPLYDYRDRLLERLETVVPVLADAVAAIPERRWHLAARSGARSPHALLAHLRDVEQEVYLARLQHLLTEESPLFQLWESANWETARYNAAEPLTDILAQYAGLREAELQLLRSLAPQQWALTGRHVTLGLHALQWWVERILENSEGPLRELRLMR